MTITTRLRNRTVLGVALVGALLAGVAVALSGFASGSSRAHGGPMGATAASSGMPAAPSVTAGLPAGTPAAPSATPAAPSATPAAPSGTPGAGAHAGAVPPIGTGWTEIHPKIALDQPPGLVRHTLINGVHHFWLFNTDPSTFPGHDAGPRSELHIENDYTSGQAQFESDIKIVNGCAHVNVMQIFGASGRSTSFMAWAMPNRLSYYGGQTIYGPVYDTYIHLNVIHDSATHKISVYVNGALRGTFTDHGGSTHYFKTGIYHQKGMPARCDVYEKNIRVFKK